MDNYHGITEKPVSFEFKVENGDMIPEGKKITKITVRPLLVGTVLKIQPLLLRIKQEDLKKIIVRDGVDFDEEAPSLFNKYQNLILDIITIGIHNKRSDPPKWFKEMLVYNTTWKDLHILFNAVVFRMGYRNFLKSINLAAERLSLQNEAEIIALQKKLKSLIPEN